MRRPRPFIKHKPRIRYDARDKSYRICIHEPGTGDDPQASIRWWPLLWLRFGSEEVAKEHLKLYGDYGRTA